MIPCPLQNTADIANGVWFQKRPRITQVFGVNANNGIYGEHGHGGVDYGAPTGTQLFSPIRGIVEVRDYGEKSYGLHVRIRNKYGFEALLAHMSEVDVKTGDEVYELQKIGKVGNTGTSTGPHLHFGFRYLIPSDKDIFKWKFVPSDVSNYGWVNPLPFTFTWKGTEREHTI